ncbi:Ger(x)C family spore germination protein [Cohnella fermenti]|uniref:Ger(X)C family spore germination protein n=1 Tax=Cohnella fermenti TaxID=2565925 RepID=A0A4S4C0P3_9BACL|nr:Ger(x)C family spore germination protein [Cohnella fermenti]THF79055.1 Ger(x)C family spore germination protein [Cohnella fermenti]
MLLLGALTLLTGCWDKNELTAWGFVQAVAIDLTESGGFRVTTQIYRPGASESRSDTSSSGKSFVTLTSEASTISQAAGQIAAQLGRNLQWSHMRALLLGEEAALNRNIGEILDFFSRSQGLRGSAFVMTTEGLANRYLLINPLIENTIGQQLKTVERLSSLQAGASTALSLINLEILAQSPGSVTLLPRLKLLKQQSQQAAIIDGMNVLRLPPGKIDSGLVPIKFVDNIMMIRGEYKRGLITLPCPSDGEAGGEAADLFKVGNAKSRLRVVSSGGLPNIKIHLSLQGGVGELVCSSVLTKAEHDRFVKRLEEKVTSDTLEALEYIQKRKADVLFAGLRVERWNPRLWKQWRSDWPELFSKAKVSVSVKIDLTTTGMDAGSPLTSQPHP